MDGTMDGRVDPARRMGLGALLKDDSDRMDLEFALMREMRHATPMGVRVCRFVDRQVVSPAGMLLQCDREGVWVMMNRMVGMYVDHVERAGCSEEDLEMYGRLIDGYRRDMYD